MPVIWQSERVFEWVGTLINVHSNTKMSTSRTPELISWADDTREFKKLKEEKKIINNKSRIIEIPRTSWNGLNICALWFYSVRQMYFLRKIVPKSVCVFEDPQCDACIYSWTGCLRESPLPQQFCTYMNLNESFKFSSLVHIKVVIITVTNTYNYSPKSQISKKGWWKKKIYMGGECLSWLYGVQFLNRFMTIKNPVCLLNI